MKKVLVGLIALTIVACETAHQEVAPYTGCASNQVVRELTAVEGTIEKVAEFYVIQTADHRYSPCSLPENLRVNGTEVVVDGQEMAIPANVRLVGTPLIITNIQLANR